MTPITNGSWALLDMDNNPGYAFQSWYRHEYLTQ